MYCLVDLSEMDADVSSLSCIPIERIYEAQEVMHNQVLRTPLIPLNVEVPGKKIYLKLENLQAVGSFKLRGALNAIQTMPKEKTLEGVYTGSAGNFAQGLAWSARRLAIPCTVLVPDNAALTKVDATIRLGAKVIKVPYATWWQIMLQRHYEGIQGHFIHPVSEIAVMAGNGTIGLELLEDLPELDTVVVPFGGGGLSCGIASAMKALKPEATIIACEVETAAPLTKSLQLGKPTRLEDHTKSFVDGMGGREILPEMWSLASSLISSTAVLSLRQVAEAVKLLVERNRTVAEGAGAATVAAALTDKVPPGNIICVISGGNIDSHKLVQILQGQVPDA